MVLTSSLTNRVVDAPLFVADQTSHGMDVKSQELIRGNSLLVVKTVVSPLCQTKTATLYQVVDAPSLWKRKQPYSVNIQSHAISGGRPLIASVLGGGPSGIEQTSLHGGSPLASVHRVHSLQTAPLTLSSPAKRLQGNDEGECTLPEMCGMLIYSRVYLCGADIVVGNRLIGKGYYFGQCKFCRPSPPCVF